MAFDAEKFFDSLNMFGIRLGLDATFELAELAGNPQTSLRFIHIAGTNGKGSCAAMLERALHNCGLRTGLYTSPHLISIRERFRIDGRAIDKAAFDRAAEELALACGDKSFSYFEFATVLAMKIFQQAQCDVVIWETGMGGRLDATNIVVPQAAIITNIALDHCAHLGNTVSAIAAEKAGIIKENVPLFHGILPDEAKEVIYEKARLAGAPVFPPRAAVPECKKVVPPSTQIFEYDGRETALSLAGKMQRENFRIVYEVLDHLSRKWDFSMDRALEAMSQVKHPARFQHIGDRIILDGGHNPDGIQALTAGIQEIYPGEKFTVVYTAFADKDAPQCIELLSAVAGEFVFTTLDTHGRDVFDASKLCVCAGQQGIACEVEKSPLKAVEYALQHSSRRVIISGSLYLAGFILQHLCSLECAENV